MTGAPPKPSDCNERLLGAPVIGFSDLLACVECGKPVAKRRRPHKCDECRRAYKNQWAKDNRKKCPDKWAHYAERAKPYQRRRYHTQRSSILSVKRKYAEANTDIIREKDKVRGRARVKTLKPHYVRQLLTRDSNLTLSDIPTELIEIKKNLVLLKRTLNENNEPDTGNAV